MPIVRQLGILLTLDGGANKGDDKQEVKRQMDQLEETTEREKRELAALVNKSQAECEGQLEALQLEWHGKDL